MAEEKIKTDTENKEILKDAQADSADEKQLSKDELEAVSGGTFYHPGPGPRKCDHNWHLE